ncbi:NAD(P)-binding protein [Hesseltinella vesiculosa]|uniref:NAD(P)-binding protein n=1 Tax=Hesseltinella vesiculosa TaxID=101127 RepID=A0A1X2G4M1_9FUNG|nr:NAD(P)-binding protein [Hesseltinella vesiculosa]
MSLWVYFVLALLLMVFYSTVLLARSNARKDHCTPINTNMTATYFLHTVDHLISQAPWLTTFISVYLLGMFETLSIVLWKRGLLGSPNQSHVEQLIDHLTRHRRLDRVPLAIITGGDSGIGFEISCGLLRAGFQVILASRSATLATEAQKKMHSLTKSNRTSFYVLDLCSYASVHSFVNHIKDTYPRGAIDLLINNAGVMNIPFALTEDAIETQFQTNCLSPMLLSLSLLPWMNPKRSHMLFASSSTLYAASHLDPTLAKTSYTLDGLTHYAHSKMAIALASKILGQKLQAQGSQVLVSSYHPGTVRTNLFSSTTVFNLPFMSFLFDFIMLTPKEGSATPLYLALSPLDGESIPTAQFWSEAAIQPLPTLIRIQSKSPYAKPSLDTFWTNMLALCDVSPLQANEWIKDSFPPVK